MWANRAGLVESESYYDGTQVVKNLRIAIPEELETVRAVVGWAATAVDPLVERLSVEGFRLPDATDADVHAGQLWRDAGGDALLSMAATDALSMGHAWWFVGNGTLTVQSPLSVVADWAFDGTLDLVLRRYEASGRKRAGIYMRDATVHVALDDDGTWKIVSRDDHRMGVVPAVRMVNRPRSGNPDGSSEITAPLRTIIDMACSIMLQLRVAGELYSVPKQVLLGATEAAFQNADGTQKTAWQAYITRIIGLERDENGEIPDIKQLIAYDPATYTKVLEMLASQAAGILAAPPQDLGLYTSGNPVSAEAASASEFRRDRKARARQRMFTPALNQVMRLMLRIENNGVLPDEYRQIGVDWDPVGSDSITAVSQAVQLQVSQGSVPPTSDVVLKKLGYDALDRARLAQDRVTDAGEAVLREIGSAPAPAAG